MPFKKNGSAAAGLSLLPPLPNRVQADDGGTVQGVFSVPSADSSSRSRNETASPASRRYPNPGYLGSSNHTALFNQLELDRDSLIDARIDGHGHDELPTRPTSDASISLGEDIIEHLFRVCPLAICINLAKSWLDTGANLPLGHAFTAASVQAVENLTTDPGDRVGLSKQLFHNSSLPLEATSASTERGDATMFNFGTPRWENICLFFISVARATLVIPYLHPALRLREQRHRIIRLAMRYACQSLDLSLSLDCLNDLQLVSQYENFLLHSIVDGDENFGCYRKLGDVASSIFTLGYHQQVACDASLPAALKFTRQAAFAHAYSADKNVSIFLGRPPRLSKRLCHFPPIGLEAYFSHEWAEGTTLDFYEEARWAAMCAALKEDCLELLKEKGNNNVEKKARYIRETAALQWSSLPQCFRLEARLRSYDRAPMELDLLLGVKLNHLHVVFLLQFALLRNIKEPDAAIVRVSAEMFELVVEALLLRERIIDSGTSLVWKVVYYGLSAAGILCLALLRPSFLFVQEHIDVSQILRDLAVLTGVVEKGSLVDAEDANYALLAGAIKAIKSVLDRVDPNSLNCRSPRHTMEEPAAPDSTAASNGSWDSWYFNYFQDLQNPFWQTIAQDQIDPNSISEVLADRET
ncbi:hypothetical protein G3M48_001909 [Beauveria asiatica]|uniref:Transcription factor domain-containing protein n=1 Tax=Beauveria asiatica TaxID=1069075 RepID=A0AAW0S799_9HYPO